MWTKFIHEVHFVVETLLDNICHLFKYIYHLLNETN